MRRLAVVLGANLRVWALWAAMASIPSLGILAERLTMRGPGVKAASRVPWFGLTA
jgi:hypothetical protein